jgi:hypothetical protein
MEPRSITLLTIDGDVPLAARIAGKDGRRLTLRVEQALESDAAIRIDTENQVLLGEVVWCSRTGDAFTAEVELDQAITSVHDLARLVDALMVRRPGAGACRAESCDRRTLT